MLKSHVVYIKIWHLPKLFTETLLLKRWICHLMCLTTPAAAKPCCWRRQAQRTTACPASRASPDTLSASSTASRQSSPVTTARTCLAGTHQALDFTIVKLTNIKKRLLWWGKAADSLSFRLKSSLNNRCPYSIRELKSPPNMLQTSGLWYLMSITTMSKPWFIAQGQVPTSSSQTYIKSRDTHTWSTINQW